MDRKKNEILIDSNAYKLNGLKRFLKHSWIYFAIATVFLLGGISLIEIIIPTPPTQLNWNWNSVLMVLVVCLGGSWLLHGTQFLIIKVEK